MSGLAVFYGSLAILIMGCAVERGWSRVFVGAGLHSMLVLFWVSTKPPLVSKLISHVSDHEINTSFVVSFFNFEGHPLLSVFVKVGIGVFLHGSVWFGNPCCFSP
jgi:hypothetical protein